MMDVAQLTIEIKENMKNNILLKRIAELTNRETSEEAWVEKHKLIIEKNNNVKIGINIMKMKAIILQDSISKNLKPTFFRKSNPFTIDNIKIWLSLYAPEYELLSGEYQGNNINMLWKLKESTLPYFYMSWNHFQGGQRHPALRTERIRNKIKTPEHEFYSSIKENLERFNLNDWTLLEVDKIPSSNCTTPLLFKHKIGYLSTLCLKHLKKGCNFKLVDPKYAHYAINNISLWVKEHTPYILKEGQVYSGTKKIKYMFTCAIHGDFSSTWGNIQHFHGCKRCASSLGEKSISSLLKERSIYFKREYTFNDLIGDNRGCLRFDFAVIDPSDQKVLFLIEYQGQQHYEPVQFGGISLEKAQIIFKQQQKHDKHKIDYCNKNNIHLIIISFGQLNCIKEIFKSEGVS